MAAIEVQHYLSRARELLEGMKILVKEEAYILDEDVVQFKHSPALLGIHCAISYSDALRIGLGRINLTSMDHKKAASDLESLLGARNYENRKGIGHLRKLIDMKNKIAYAPITLRENEVEDAVKHAERFRSSKEIVEMADKFVAEHSANWEYREE